MDKRSFIENVIEQVREIPTTEIVSEKVVLYRKGGYDKGLCPFHNDKHIGSFVVSDRKGIYKCFSCGEGGDTISFVKKTENVNYVEGAMRIALRRGIITHSDYEDFFSKKFSDKKARQIEKIYIDKDRDKFKQEIAPVSVLNNVFKAFITEASLSEEHKKYLVEKRGFSIEDIIEGGYLTFPSRRETFIKSFIERLKKDYGYNSDILQHVPGFYREKNMKKWLFSYTKGIGIPIKGADQLIAGIQIRRDKAEENKSRYIWFSSAFIEYDEKLMEKYEFGTSSGSPIDVIYPKELKHACIFITEGRFKAKKLVDNYDSVAISVQGVGSWRNIVEQVKIIQTKYPHISFKNIYVAFDGDMAYNVQVFNQAMNMTNKLKEELSEIGIHYNMWATEYGKGIDDVILAGHKNMIDIMEKSKFDKLYKDFIKLVETKEGIKINDVDKELLKAYFDTLVLPKFKKYKQDRLS